MNFPPEMKRLDERIAEQDLTDLAAGARRNVAKRQRGRDDGAAQQRVTLLALAISAAAWRPRSAPHGAADHRRRRRRPSRISAATLDLASQDPAVALERLQPADGYEVTLFASEREFPELANPLAMTFDTRGRLWVLTSPTYPHVGPDETPNDKLIILEDGNGDGRADKADGVRRRLYIPTGFELGDGGVYVSQQPNLMFLRDTNGDGKADERRVILHGFGTEDSHHADPRLHVGPGRRPLLPGRHLPPLAGRDAVWARSASTTPACGATSRAPRS